MMRRHDTKCSPLYVSRNWSPALKFEELLCSVAAAAAVIVDTGSCFVVQTSLELVGSFSSSQIVGERDMHHHPQPPDLHSSPMPGMIPRALHMPGRERGVISLLQHLWSKGQAPMTHWLHVITSHLRFISISLGFHKASSWLLPRFRIISTRCARQNYSYKRIKILSPS